MDRTEWSGGDLWNASRRARQAIAQALYGPYAQAQPLTTGLSLTVVTEYGPHRVTEAQAKGVFYRLIGGQS